MLRRPSLEWKPLACFGKRVRELSVELLPAIPGVLLLRCRLFRSDCHAASRSAVTNAYHSGHARTVYGRPDARTGGRATGIQP